MTQLPRSTHGYYTVPGIHDHNRGRKHLIGIAPLSDRVLRILKDDILHEPDELERAAEAVRKKAQEVKLAYVRLFDGKDEFGLARRSNDRNARRRMALKGRQEVAAQGSGGEAERAEVSR